jgi:Matrixin
MGFFVFPQAWITPAIAAAALHFGPIDGQVKVKYRQLDRQLGQAVLPNKIVVDKLPAREWPKERAQCVLIHEYGHLAGREHSEKPRSIMHAVLRYKPCHRWLVKHDVK